MGQSSMGPVPFAPLVEHRQDRGDLLVEQTVHRDPAGPAVGQLGAPPRPALHPTAADLQDLAGGPQGPALGQGMVDQGQQAGLPNGVDPGRHRLGHRHPEPPIPSSRVNLTANSFTASLSRAISACAPSSSTSRGVLPTPGFDADRAARAPSLATWRNFMIVDRSTPAASAAALIVVSPRTSCNQILYFTDGANNFFARRTGLAGLTAASLFVEDMHTLSRVSQTPQCGLIKPSKCDTIPDAGHGQIRAREGSVRHVEVFLMGGVGTSIIGRPRPLPGQLRAQPTYTLLCEEMRTVKPLAHDTSRNHSPGRDATQEGLDVGPKRPVPTCVEGRSAVRGAGDKVSASSDLGLSAVTGSRGIRSWPPTGTFSRQRKRRGIVRGRGAVLGRIRSMCR